MSALESAHGRSSSAWTRPRPHPDSRRGSDFAQEHTCMKVLFTKRNYAPMGGSESLTYQWATRLAARGHDVRVVCGQAFDTRPRYEDHGVDVIQVKPRGGFLGQVADASMMLDMMNMQELERHAEDRDLIHNVGREYLDSSLNVAQALDLPVVLTPLAHPGQFHGGDTPADFLRYRRATVMTTMTDWERGWFRDRKSTRLNSITVKSRMPSSA